MHYFSSLLSSLSSMTWQDMAWGAGIFLATFLGSLGITAWAIVRLPANYFHSSHAREFWTDQPAAIRWAGLAAKNVAGLLLVILGVILSLPGVPGQGLLTILLGLVLLDIPGKRPWEARLVRLTAVRNAIDGLRARYGKLPLVLD